MDSIPKGAWIVVADGGQARLFHNVGNARVVELSQQKKLEPEYLATDGPAGPQPPEAGEAYIDEARFAKHLAERLNAGALKHEYEHLVLLADPQTLGQIRPLLHQETSKRLVVEMAKTLTNVPLEDIEKLLNKDA